MDNVEYILRIILRARDEMAAVLAKARAELVKFGAETDRLNTKLDGLNSRITSLNTRVGNVTNKIEAWRASMRGFTEGSDGAGRSVQGLVKDVDKLATTSDKAVKAQQDLAQRFAYLKDQMKQTNAEFTRGGRSADEAVDSYKRIGTALRSLVKDSKIGSDLQYNIQASAREAERASKEIEARGRDQKTFWETLHKELIADEQSRSEAVTQIYKTEADDQVRVVKERNSSMIADDAATQKELEGNLKGYNQRVDALIKDFRKSWEDEEKRSAAVTIAIDKSEAAERVRIEESRQQAMNQARERGIQATTRIAEEERKAAEVASEAARRQDEVSAAYESFSRRVRDGEVSAAAARRELQRFGAEFDSIGRKFEAGSREATQWAGAAERARAGARGIADDADHAGSAFGRFVGEIQSAGDNVATLDNRIRGILLLAVAGFVQQLLTAVVALGGEMVNLAGSATMAGAALGGSFSAGLAQAIPAIGLLFGAMTRVQAVFNAFQQGQKLQQAAFTSGEKAANKQADTDKTLANAQDSVTSASERLAAAHDGVATAQARVLDAQEKLTKARSDGVRQLQDLVYQEKAAELAARGASITLAEAQKALQQAVQSGASVTEIQSRQLDVSQARLGVTRSRTEATRATQDRAAPAGNVENLDSVRQAEKGVADARKGVEQARQQVEDSVRALTQAQRGLDDAANKASRTAAATMTAQANLDFLLSQLSPAERRLYETLNKIYGDYREIFIGKIYPVIIDSFTRAVDRVDSLMKMPGVIKTAQGLAQSIATQINKITDAATNPGQIGQFTRIIADARQNIGPVTDDVIKLVKAFLNVAEAGNPAFQHLLRYIGGIVDKLLGLTTNRKGLEDFFLSGERHLESWGNLILAVINLFAALVGASAGEGKKSVDDLTKTINGAADGIRDHGQQVGKFFSDARKAAYDIAGVVVNLGKEIIRSFNPGSFHNFADILNNVIIPALGEIVRVVGQLTGVLARLVDNPVGAFIAKGAIMALIFGQLASSSLGAINYFTRMWSHLTDVGKAMTSVTGAAKGLGGSISATGKAFQDAGQFAEAEAGKTTLMSRAYTLVGTTLTKVGPAVRAAAAFMFGPWGIIIGAVVIGIVLLLKHFHMLDDLSSSISKGFHAALQMLQPAIDGLKDALGGLGITFGKTGNAIKLLNQIGHALAVFFVSVLSRAITGAFEVIAAVIGTIIRLFTGFINMVHGFADVIIGIFTLNPDKILRGYGLIAKGVLDVVGGIVEGVVNGLKGIVDIFLSPFRAAWNAIKDFFGIKSPSTLFAGLGKDILAGIKAGLKGIIGIYKLEFELAWKAVKAVFNGARSFGGWIVDKIGDGLRAGVGAIRAVASWMWGRFKDGVGDAVHFGKTIVSDIVRGFKTLPGLLADAVAKMGDALINVGKQIGEGLWKGIKKAPGAVGHLLESALPFAEGGPVPGTGSGDSVRALLTPGEHVLTKDEVQAAGGHSAIFALRRLLGGGGQAGGSAFADGGAVGAAASLTIAFQGGGLDDFNSKWRGFWSSLTGTARGGTTTIDQQFDKMRDNASKDADRMYRNIRGSLSDIQDSFNSRGNAITKNWGSTFDDLMQVTFKAFQYIANQTNKSLRGLGEKTVNFGLVQPRNGDGKAGGGWIGKMGQRGRDAGFYALGAGEAVLNWTHQKVVEPAMNAYYGFGLNEMFGRVRGYHAGGPESATGYATGRPGAGIFDGHPSNVSPAIRALIELMKRHFPALAVSSTTDHSLRTTTGGISDHSTGHAVDLAADHGTLVRAANWIKSSGLYRRLKQGIFNPLLAVNAGKFVDGPGFFAQAWPQHLTHIHMALAGALGNVANLAGNIGRIKITPQSSTFAQMVAGAVNAVRKAANMTLGMAGGDTYSTGLSGTVDNSVAKTIIAVWQRLRSTPKRLLSAFETGIVESGMRNLSGGDADSAGWRQERRSLYPDPTNVAHAAERYFQEAARFDHGQDAGTLAADVQRPAEQYRGRYAQARNAAIELLRKFGVRGFAEGGIIPGSDGDPIGIVAHAGEWILNRFQQSKLASLLGTGIGGLRSMLGFSIGGTSFQDGGEIGTAGASVGHIRLSTSEQRRQTAAAAARAKAEIASGVKAYLDLLDDAKVAWKGIKDIATIARRKAGNAKVQASALANTLKIIDGITDPNTGLIKQIQDGISTISARAATTLKRASLRIASGNQVVSRMSDSDITGRQIQDLINETHELVGEKGVIQRALGTVTAQLKKHPHNAALLAQQSLLQKNLDDVNSAIADNLQNRLTAQIQQQQQVVDSITKRHDDTASGLDIQRRIAQALGNTDMLSVVNQNIASNLASEAADLQQRIAAARAAGATDLADQLTKQVADLNTQVFEAAQQALQDAVDAINSVASRRLSRLDLFGRMADALGVISDTTGVNVGGETLSRAGVFQQRGAVLAQQRTGLQGMVTQAAAAGNVKLVQDLTDQLAELDVTIAENTKAAFDARVQQITSTHDYTDSMIDLQLQLLDLDGQISGQVDATQKAALLQQKANDLVAKGNELTALLAEATPGTQQYQDLQKAILENKIAVSQNTIALNEASGQTNQPQTFTSTAWQWFREAIFNGIGGVLPQYSPPVGASVASSTGALGGAGMNVSASTTTNSNGNNITNNFEINEAGQPIDETRLAGVVNFSQKSAQ